MLKSRKRKCLEICGSVSKSVAVFFSDLTVANVCLQMTVESERRAGGFSVYRLLGREREGRGWHEEIDEAGGQADAGGWGGGRRRVRWGRGGI